MDDIADGADDWDTFLKVVRGFFATIRFHNLRLKGKKVKLLGTTLYFLGKKISNGKIFPSPHAISKITNYEIRDIITKKQLLSFIGLVSYLSDHLFQASVILHCLRQAAKGPLAEHVNWVIKTKDAFEKTKAAMLNTVVLSAPCPTLPHFSVVDTSKIATGAVFFAKDGDEKRVIGIFSRKRTDAENKKITPSCIAELAGIGAAISYFMTYISELSKPLTVLTDSKSAAAAFTKFKILGHPTNNMRLSAFLNATFGVNFNLIYTKNSDPDIQCVDFLSRVIPKSFKECTSCKVCEVAQYISDDLPITVQTRHACLRTIQKTFHNVNFAPNSFELDAQQDFIPARESLHLFWKEPSVHISFNAFTRSHHIPKFTGLVEDLIRNNQVIRAWQMSDTTLREAARCLDEGHDPVKDRVRTLLINNKAFLDKGVLKHKLTIKTDCFAVIILPNHKVVIDSIVECFHNSMGHNTKSAFLNEVKRVFDVKSTDVAFDKKIKNCPGCSLLRIGKNRFKSFKEVPLPNYIGESILVDEVHRTFFSKNIRFTIASDSLSRFTKIYPLEGAVTKDKFIDIVLRISDDFLFFKRTPTNPSLQIRCDQLPAHVAAAGDIRLKERGISITFHDPTSAEGKQIPELDGRIAKISRIMNVKATTERCSNANDLS